MVYRKTKKPVVTQTPISGRTRVKDIAQVTGVSETTVASILSGRNVVRVAEATRQHVLDAALEMGYRRNRLATALRTGRTNTIGIVSPLTWSGVQGNVHLMYLTSLLAAISVATARVGMNAMTFIDSPLQDLPAGEVADGRVTGVVVFGMPMNLEGAEAWMQELCGMGLPIVEIGSSYSPYQVHVDNVRGAHLAVEHFRELGHQRIAFWPRLNGAISSEQRKAGFDEAVRPTGLPADYTPHIGSSDELISLLQQPQRPTALFCNDDNRALFAYQRIREVGLRIPEDISVIGFDNSPFCGAMYPRLTSVESPWDILAQTAISLILAQLEGKELPSPSPLIEPRLVLRDSTAPPSALPSPSGE